ncbi:MAG: TlpA family protein disulfide reductase [Magnetococcus sp. DMHC-8]
MSYGPMQSCRRSTLWWLALLWVLLPGCKETTTPTVLSRAPDFTLETFDGPPWRLGDHLGKPVVLNFFASWCVPCGEEAPAFEEGYQEFKQKGVQFVGIASQDTHSKAKEFVRKYGLTYPSGLDASGVIREAYGVFGMPTTFFVDKKGFINYLHIGGVNRNLMRHELEKIL